MLVARRAAVALVLVLAACGPKLIPNTKIEDTQDNQAILDLVKTYKNAFEAKDAKGIMALASPRYLDQRDNISYGTLENDLSKDFERVKDLQLEVNVRRIEVTGDVAEVDYFYSTNYQLATADAPWKNESDEKRMRLAREDNVWKVTMGF